jgi:chromosome segregation ATPase
LLFEINIYYSQISAESEEECHEAKLRAVSAITKCERMEREMKDMDKLACHIKKSKEDLEQRLTKCEEDFQKCCSENHKLKAELNHPVRGHSYPGVSKSVGEKKLQEKLDTATIELIDAKERGEANLFYSKFMCYLLF